MVSQYKINGIKFYEAIVAGSVELISNKKTLNKINVFPVADGDTGSNMSATVESVMAHMKKSENLSVVANSAAEGALLGARGNSGIIFAQFLYGFCMEAKQYEEIDFETFIKAMKNASARLYEVMLNPVEGTILTLIKTWVSAMEQHRHQTNLHTFLGLTMEASAVALEKTKEQLQVLKDRNVVDSGAKGFYSFLEGVQKYMVTGKVPEMVVRNADVEIVQHETAHEVQSAYRYCCEAMLSECELEAKVLKQAMGGYGDSLIVAGGKDYMRLHMHTNDPEAMFSRLGSLGRISQIKADDMHLQMAAVQAPARKIAIVTDSIADLPEDYEKENQIFVLPLLLEVDGVTHLDRISLTTKRFYQINRHLKEQPQSSLPSVKQVESLLQFLAEHYEAILVLCVSDKLSGTYQMIASVAALKRENGAQIEVVNTLKNSAAQGLMVLEAVKMADKDLPLSEIVRELKALSASTKILVAVDTVKYLERSGRVSHQVGKIAKWLNLKPIMTLDTKGNGKAYGGAVSLKSVLKKIEKVVRLDQQRQGLLTYCIVHADALAEAQAWAITLERLLGQAPAYIAEISPIVGATAGEGALAIGYITKEK